MPSFKNLGDSLKKAFQSVAPRASIQEYDFANDGKTAHVTTKKTLFSSSYTMTFSDGKGTTGEVSAFELLRDVRAKGVNKAKDYCGITG